MQTGAIHYTGSRSGGAVTHSAPSTCSTLPCDWLQKVIPFIKYSICIPNCMHMKNVPVCLWRPLGGRWFCRSLMHANLCRWHHYCRKMDCLIKHIIRHICCLTDQIEVVFWTNFSVKFVNVLVIFVLGHGKNRKKSWRVELAPIWAYFCRWSDFSTRFVLYQEESWVLNGLEFLCVCYCPASGR